MRRRTASVSGTISYRDGREEPLEAATLAQAPEAALRALSLAMVLLAVALVWLRLA